MIKEEYFLLSVYQNEKRNQHHIQVILQKIQVFHLF
ncbi:hypothetical protein LEP1GSC115_0116, partial [Leptospira interrogans serovar Australis str. 200703203]